MPVGTVYLIGAGPGDPRLITVGGADALRHADVVVYDRLAHPSLLDYAPDHAEKIYVGKKADQHAMRQDQINALLVEKALEGKRVARLKGGDPFVFGRGGEEAEYLRERGVPWTLIPGVTSAIAAPAYAGIPVTHRDAASSFAVITGHEREGTRESGTREGGAAEGRRRWDKIAHAADTLLFLMGVENLEEIVRELLAHGREPSVPVALVRWGTWAGHQETLVATLGTVVQDVQRAGFKAPAVTVVGDVVALRERLRWFDTGPLAGKRIVVTRAREQSSAFAMQLRDKNADPIEFPLIRTEAPEDECRALDARLQKLGSYQWICFASATGVDAFFARLPRAALDARALAAARIGCVGSATAAALHRHGILADFVSEGFTGLALAQELPGELSGTAILLPRAQEGDDAIVHELRRRGAILDDCPAYRTVMDGAHADEIARRLAQHTIDAITFTSSSTVKNFAACMGTQIDLSNVTVACIGPSTAQTLRDVLQREPDVVAAEHTVPGLIEALEAFYAADGEA